MIKIKRVYDSPAPEDGLRFLVDRLHPRGVKKGALHIEAWQKDSAPSGALRTWFGHDASRWDEFCQRNFAARGREHNNAAALKMDLEKYLKRK